MDKDDDGDGVYTKYEGVNPDGDLNPNTGNTLNTDHFTDRYGKWVVDLVPDYLDNDDDGDGVLTMYEGANHDGDGNPNTGTTLNTDAPVENNPNPNMREDTIPNYLDFDDDGDGYATWEEGANPDGDGNPNTGVTLDTDNEGIPDYLDYSNTVYPATRPIVLNNYVNLTGDKQYELSNHLGNVISVISDKKIPSLSSGALAYFNPEVLSYSDYYPFGMLVPSRHGKSEDYRYGFNGKELDNELKGEGNSYDYGDRMFDPRIGRWFVRDAKEREFPDVSPYQYSLNNPIIVTDPDGKKPRVTVTNEVVGYGYQRVHDPEGKLGYDAYIKVPLYKVIVEDTKNKSYHREYAAVRDAYEVSDIKIDKNNKTVVKLINRSFEPINKNMKFELSRTSNFPSGNDAAGYQITYQGGGTLLNDPGYSGEKSKSGVFLHVGGIYKNTNDGGTRPVYSEGCMDLCDPNQFNIPIQDLIAGKHPEILGNEYVKKFDNEYQKIAKKDIDTKTKKPKNAELKVEKRPKPKTPTVIKKYVPKNS